MDTPGRDPPSFLALLREHLQWANEQAQAWMQQAQDKQKCQYDQQAHTRHFQVVNQVLVRSLLFPKCATREWEGPFTITLVKGPLTYEGRARGCKALHVNLIKQ